MDGSQLLTSGLYTVSDAVRFVGVSSQKVRGWVAGYPRTQAPAILENEVGFYDGRLAMGFLTLMEVRFVAYFANNGVQVQSLRLMADEAKELLKHDHPFATNTIFTTDGRKIFAHIAEATGDRRMYDLQAKNWAFHDIIAQSLLEGVTFNPGGTAKRWHPSPSTAPNIVLDPIIAFGQPTLKDSGVPTQALYNAFRAEDETYESVAAWYDVPTEQVQEAIRFEVDLARAP